MAAGAAQKLPPPSYNDGRRQTSRPLPPPRVNFIPEQNWLAYNWIDKDPELDFMCWAIQSSGKTLEWIERETEKVGHKVSRYTMLRWMQGDAKRTHNVTMNTVMAVLGYNRPWRHGSRLVTGK
jgi:hypothetical protein